MSVGDPAAERKLSFGSSVCVVIVGEMSVVVRAILVQWISLFRIGFQFGVQFCMQGCKLDHQSLCSVNFLNSRCG